MKEEDLLRAFNHIDPEYVMEAEEVKHKVHKPVTHYMAIAASVAILLLGCYGAGSLLFYGLGTSNDKDSVMSGSSEPATNDKDTLGLDDSEGACDNTAEVEAAVVYIDGTSYIWTGTDPLTEEPEEIEYKGKITYLGDSEEIPKTGIYADIDLAGDLVYQYGDKIVIVVDERYYIFEEED